MTSITGYVPFLKYTLSTTKGQVTAPQEYNSPLKLSKVDNDYTGARVVEDFTAASSPAAVALVWAPAVKKVFVDPSNNTAYDVKLIDVTTEGAYVTSYTDLDSDGKIPASAQTGSHKYKVAYV